MSGGGTFTRRSSPPQPPPAPRVGIPSPAPPPPASPRSCPFATLAHKRPNFPALRSVGPALPAPQPRPCGPATWRPGPPPARPQGRVPICKAASPGSPPGPARGLPAEPRAPLSLGLSVIVSPPGRAPRRVLLHPLRAVLTRYSCSILNPPPIGREVRRGSEWGSAPAFHLLLKMRNRAEGRRWEVTERWR